MGKGRTFFIPTVSVANNAVNVLVDSTNSLAVATPSSLVPGPYRGRWANMGVKGTVAATGQNVTLNLEVLTGSAGTSSDWEIESSGTVTVTAGTTYSFRWRPVAPDFRIREVNGAAGPTTLVCRLELIPIEEVET